jgi:hypothetical protein
MIRLTRIREYTPEFAMKIFLRFRDTMKKWKKRFKKFRKSKNRFDLIKKKLPFLRILTQSGSVYYTRMYEKLRVNQKDILFESKHGEDVAGNIFALLQELAGEPYKEYRALLAMEKDNMQQYQELLENYGLTKVTMIDIRSKAYAKALDCKIPCYGYQLSSLFYQEEGTGLSEYLARNTVKGNGKNRASEGICTW